MADVRPTVFMVRRKSDGLYRQRGTSYYWMEERMWGTITKARLFHTKGGPRAALHAYNCLTKEEFQEWRKMGIKEGRALVRKRFDEQYEVIEVEL